MDVPVLTHPSGGGYSASLTPEQAADYHEFFRQGVERDLVLLGGPEEQWVHHLEGKKRRLCTANIGRCTFCETAPQSTTIEPRQRESVIATMMRPVRGKEFVQRVAVFPRAASEEVRDLCGDHFRGRIFRIERGKSNRLKIRDRGHWQYPTPLPPAFPMLPFILARFSLRQDPNVPLVLLPAIRVEESRSTSGELPHIGINATNALDAAELAAGAAAWRELRAKQIERDAAEKAEQAAPTPSNTSAPSASEVRDSSPVAASHASNAAAETSRAATGDTSSHTAATMTPPAEKVVDSIKRRIGEGIHNNRGGEVVDELLAEVGIPVTIPMPPRNGHHLNGKHHANGKGGVR